MICECGCGRKTSIVAKSDARYLRVRGVYSRFIRGHQASRPLAERFWRHVDRATPDQCWEWTGSRNDSNYGRMGVARKLELVHRVSWYLHTGQWPTLLRVLHRCDNPPCVNPGHLFLGTMKDNAQDREAKGRGNPGGYRHKTRCKNGHEYTPDNIYSARGYRECMECRRVADRKRGRVVGY